MIATDINGIIELFSWSPWHFVEVSRDYSGKAKVSVRLWNVLCIYVWHLWSQLALYFEKDEDNSLNCFWKAFIQCLRNKCEGQVVVTLQLILIIEMMTYLCKATVTVGTIEPAGWFVGLFLFFFQEYLWAVWLSCRGTALLWRLWCHLFYANKLASAATIAACQMWVQNWAVWSQCHWSVSAHCRRCTLPHLFPTDPPSGRMLQGNRSDTMNSTADSLGGILLLCPCM